jgi:putative addiction module component (TIGR02574 family)
MATTLDDLKSAASDLPVPERAELARYLLDSLDEGEQPAARADWLALAESRMAEVKAGSVVGIPADDVLRDLLEPPR